MENGHAGPAYALRADVVATILDHGALLLDLESKYFYLLNPSGWSVVQLFEDGATIDHAVERARDWGAPETDVEGVRATLGTMVSERLLVISEAVANGLGEAPPAWTAMSVEKQAEPLQRVIVSAFDPSIPLAE